MFRLLTPHHRIAGVLELTPERLRGLGLESLLLDADGTLKRYTSDECAPGVAEWLDSLKQAGFGLCLVSNGLGERIGRFAEKVCLPFVPKAMKPFPRGCRQAMQKMGFRRNYRYGGGSGFCRRDGRPSGGADNLSRRADPSRGRALVHAAEAAGGTLAVGKVGSSCREERSGVWSESPRKWWVSHRVNRFATPCCGSGRFAQRTICRRDRCSTHPTVVMQSHISPFRQKGPTLTFPPPRGRMYYR